MLACMRIAWTAVRPPGRAHVVDSTPPGPYNSPSKGRAEGRPALAGGSFALGGTGGEAVEDSPQVKGGLL